MKIKAAGFFLPRNVDTIYQTVRCHTQHDRYMETIVANLLTLRYYKTFSRVYW